MLMYFVYLSGTINVAPSGLMYVKYRNFDTVLALRFVSLVNIFSLAYGIY